MSYEVAYRYLHEHFPLGSDMEDIIVGALRSKLINMQPSDKGPVLYASYEHVSGSNNEHKSDN